MENLKTLEQVLDTSPEYQLPEPQGFMSAWEIIVTLLCIPETVVFVINPVFHNVSYLSSLLFSAGRGICRQAGSDGTAKGRKPDFMGSKNE